MSLCVLWGYLKITLSNNARDLVVICNNVTLAIFLFQSEDGDSDSCAQVKRARLDSEKENVSSRINGHLSPEQKQRMEENRQKALAKLQAKQTDGLLVDVGESWLKALEPEFSKTYFSQVIVCVGLFYLFFACFQVL